MGFSEVNRQPSIRELKQFGGILLPLFLVLVGALLYRKGSSIWLAGLLWLAAVASSGIAYTAPRLIRPLFVGWMLAAYPIGWTVSRLALAGIFYLMITPIGLILRLRRYDPLGRRWDESAASYWERRRDSPVERYFNQF